MNAVEIEEAVSHLAEAPFDAEEFPFAFLLAFGNKETTIKLKCPGFTGGFFIQNLCDVIKGVHACIECVLHFLWRPMADCAM